MTTNRSTHRVLSEAEATGSGARAYVFRKVRRQLLIALLVALVVGLLGQIAFRKTFVNLGAPAPDPAIAWAFVVIGLFAGVTWAWINIADAYDDLTPLEPYEIDEVAGYAQRSETVRAWVQEAVQARHELRRRDRIAAYTTTLHEEDERRSLAYPHRREEALQRLAESVTAQETRE